VPEGSRHGEVPGRGVPQLLPGNLQLPNQQESGNLQGGQQLPHTPGLALQRWAHTHTHTHTHTPGLGLQRWAHTHTHTHTHRQRTHTHSSHAFLFHFFFFSF
ncbi:unnamed protein product, partial [Tetraodon nigroviridis]